MSRKLRGMAVMAECLFSESLYIYLFADNVRSRDRDVMHTMPFRLTDAMNPRRGRDRSWKC